MKTIIKKTEIDEEKVHHVLDATVIEINPKIANA